MRLGDLTGDGIVNDDDVDRYVEALQVPDQVPGQHACVLSMVELDTMIYANHVDPTLYLTDFNLDGATGLEEVLVDPTRAGSNPMKAVIKDMDAICHAIQDSEQLSDWLIDAMDVNDDQDITLADLEQVADEMGLVIGDIEMWWVSGPPMFPDLESLDGTVDYDYFQDWESFFSQARRSGRAITWSQGDLNCNGVADEGDIPT